MIKLFLSMAALLLASLAAPAHAAPPEVQIAHPALWKVQGPNATIYLFGTIHLLPADVRWFDGTIAQAVAQSDTLVTEILDPTPDELRPILAASALLPAGESLRQELGPEQRRRFEAALAANHLAPDAFDRFRPWYAAVALTTLPMTALGYDPAKGVDVWLAAHAKATGQPQQALETVQFQLGLFASLPQPVQKAYLMTVIGELPQIRPELTGIIHAWEAGRADRLARLMNADEDDPQMIKLLLTDRNRTWATWIKARLANPSKPHEVVFLAVGAGHLAGPGSVQDQLRALGIASQRVQ